MSNESFFNKSSQSSTVDSNLEVETLVIQDLALLPRLVQVFKQMLQVINLALYLTENQYSETAISNKSNDSFSLIILINRVTGSYK